MNTEIVAFCVFEPGGFFRAQNANVIHGLESGKVVVLEHHALAF
jgi:hypothetical protein